MRKMKDVKTGMEINVRAHFITKNFWEFYMVDKKNGLVMGFETEYGPVDLDEIKPHIVSATRDLDDVMPATGWDWVN